MDYRRYCFRREEYIRYGLEAAGLSMVIAFCFYNSPVALILGIPVAFWYFREKRKKLSERRKAAVKLQFKDAVQGMAAALAAGYSVENAVRETGRDLRMIYEENADMVQELAAMSFCYEKSPYISASDFYYDEYSRNVDEGVRCAWRRV